MTGVVIRRSFLSWASIVFRYHRSIFWVLLDLGTHKRAQRNNFKVFHFGIFERSKRDGAADASPLQVLRDARVKKSHAIAIFPVIKHGKLIADVHFELLKGGVVGDWPLVVHDVSSCRTPDCPSAPGPDDRRIVHARNTPPSNNEITPATAKAAEKPA